MMKRIDLSEQHLLLLELAKTFDQICTEHGIPYYMLGGTMLGAIRHKGFIPWDDDMDFGVPRPYYEKLRVLLENNLPNRYKCRTYHNSKNVYYPFYKIEDTYTKCLNGQYIGDFNDFLGINIDVFPLDLCQKADKRMKRIIWMNDKYGRVFTGSATGNKVKAFSKKIIRFIFPLSKDYCYNYIDNQIKKIKAGDFLANVFGHWEEKEIIPIDWYGLDCRYEFEGIMLMGLKEYDKYLRQLYNNYMELPPVDKRTCHSANVYYIGKL